MASPTPASNPLRHFYFGTANIFDVPRTRVSDVAFVFKKVLHTTAHFTNELSTFCSFARHALQIQDAARLLVDLNPAVINGLALLDSTVKLSDGFEILNQTDSELNRWERRSWTNLAAAISLFVGNVIGAVMFVQSLGVKVFQATLVTSQALPPRLISIFSYIADHSLTGKVLSWTPTVVKESMINRRDRALAMPLNEFLDTVAIIGFASYFFFSAVATRRSKPDCVQNVAKFAATAVIGIAGVSNAYAKGALGLFAMAAVGYNVYRRY